MVSLDCQLTQASQLVLLAKCHQIDRVKEIQSGMMFSTQGTKEESIHRFAGNPKRKRLLGRTRRKKDAIIKMDLRETEWCGMDWINLAQDRHQ
jgi:hypothetical protein